MRERRVLQIGFIEVIVWRPPQPLSGSPHSFKYRLACAVEGECVLRYDNEPGKGDHRHLGAEEMPHAFSSVGQLLGDFLADAVVWKGE